MRISKIIFYLILTLFIPWTNYSMHNETKEQRQLCCELCACTFSHEYSYYAHLADKHKRCFKCEKNFTEKTYVQHANSCKKNEKPGTHKWRYKRDLDLSLPKPMKNRARNKIKKISNPALNHIEPESTTENKTSSPLIEPLPTNVLSDLLDMIPDALPMFDFDRLFN